MRVFYRALRRSVVVYRQTSVSFCCIGMAHRWGNLIGFGVRDVRASTSRKVSLFIDRPQTSGRSILELVPIQHCPFCGEIVETLQEKRKLARKAT